MTTSATVKINLDQFKDLIRSCNGKEDDKSLNKTFKDFCKNQKSSKTNTKAPAATKGPRKTTAYQLFCFEKRPEVTTEVTEDPDNEGLLSKEIFGMISKKLSEMWKECKDLEEYQMDSDWYNKTLALKEQTPKKTKKTNPAKKSKKAPESEPEIESESEEEEAESKESNNNNNNGLPEPDFSSDEDY